MSEQFECCRSPSKNWAKVKHKNMLALIQQPFTLCIQILLVLFIFILLRFVHTCISTVLSSDWSTCLLLQALFMESKRNTRSKDMIASRNYRFYSWVIRLHVQQNCKASVHHRQHTIYNMLYTPVCTIYHFANLYILPCVCTSCSIQDRLQCNLQIIWCICCSQLTGILDSIRPDWV